MAEPSPRRRGRQPTWPDDAEFTYAELVEEARAAGVDPEPVVPFIVNGPVWVDRLLSVRPTNNELVGLVKRLGLMGLALLARLSPVYSGMGNQDNARRYADLHRLLYDETFQCKLRIVEGKRGREVYYRISNNFHALWEARRQSFYEHAEAAGFQQRTIYQTFWQRAYWLTVLWLNIMCAPLAAGFAGVQKRALLLEDMHLVVSRPEWSGRIRVEPYTGARPPLPPYTTDEATSKEGIEVAVTAQYVDWDKYDAMRQLVAAIAKRTTNPPLDWDLFDRTEWAQPHANYRLAIGGATHKSGWPFGQVAFAGSAISVRTRRAGKIIRIYNPASWPENKGKRCILKMRTSDDERVNAVAEFDARRTAIFRVVTMTNWPHTAIFNAALVMSQSAAPWAETSEEIRASLVCDLVDIETMWRANLMRDGLQPEGMTHLLTRLKRHSSWADATDEDMKDAELLCRMTLATDIAFPGQGLRSLKLHRLRHGLQVLALFAGLHYERYARIERQTLRTRPLPVDGAPRPARTIEELLSEGWPGYSLRHDPVMTSPLMPAI